MTPGVARRRHPYRGASCKDVPIAQLARGRPVTPGPPGGGAARGRVNCDAGTRADLPAVLQWARAVSLTGRAPAGARTRRAATEARSAREQDDA